jgi:hypothetical protein
MSRRSDVLFVLVQGCASFGSQCDVVNLIQLLWILFAVGVIPRAVRAFLAPIKEISGWPSPGAGLPPLTIPADYRDRVSSTRGGLRAAIDAVLATIWEVPEFMKIVFVYLNHGSPAELGPASDDGLTADDFVSWSDQALRWNKKILFVLDACYSTPLAKFVWGTCLSRGHHPADLGAHVGFLTSAERDCHTSAVVISKEARLIYMYLDGEGAAIGDFAPGYRVQNSMFARQLNDLLAYRLGDSNPVLVAGLPAWMNAAEPMRYGFQCSFVGDEEQVGATPLGDFLPFGLLDAAEANEEWNDIPFGQILPDAPMLGLADDVGRFFDVRGRSKAYGELAVEVSSSKDGGVVYGEGLLLSDLPSSESVRARLAAGRYRTAEGETWTPVSIESWLPGITIDELDEFAGSVRPRRWISVAGMPNPIGLIDEEEEGDFRPSGDFLEAVPSRSRRSGQVHRAADEDSSEEGE